jgi:hypothetical protein
MFASWTAASLARSMSTADPDLSAGAPEAPADARPYDATRLAKLEDTLKRYEDHFNRHLRILLDRYVEPWSIRLPSTMLTLSLGQFELFRGHGECCAAQTCAFVEFDWEG